MNAPTLLEAVGRLNEADSPDTVLRTATELAVALIPVRQASIATSEPDHVLLRHHWVDGIETAADATLPLDGSISGWVIRGGGPYRCDDLDALPPFMTGGMNWAEAPKPKSVLSVPLADRSGTALAALNLFDRTDGAPFSDADLELAVALAGHAGVALEKATMLAGLQEREQRLRAILENAPEIVSVLAPDGTILYEGPSMQRLTGFLPEQLVGRQATDVVHPEDAVRMRHYFRRMLATKEALEPIEYRVQYRDGSWHYLEAIVRNLLDDSRVRGVLVTSRDITERKRYEDQIIRHAFSDPVTELPNRALFMDRLSHALDAISRRSVQIAVMLLDFDDYQSLSEELGAGRSERLLVGIAERIRERLRGGDTVARLPGYQFGLLFEDMPHARGVERIAQRVLAAFDRPVSLDGEQVSLRARLGIAVAQAASAGPTGLLQEAEAALYRAKAAGQAQFTIFEADMSAAPADQDGLENELRTAVERGELVLHYQPEVEFRTGRIVGVEALVRWQHPRRGMLLPTSFIPLAEETGTILSLGSWVLEQACRQAQAWQQFGSRRRPQVVSVNFSVREFQQPGIVDKVARTLRETGLHPRALRIEITESTMMHAAASTVSTLRSLKDLGVRLAIDDFGTGYSALSYLRQFPVDTIKIDQSFVGELDRRPETREIVRAVTRLARALDMEVTAEGVETAEQQSLLEGLHCRRGQGHLFWKPLPSDEITELLRAQAQV
jgi:PAS domain S-box-containing protein/diguanylate cyclase (GGDEF)-like protein